VQQRDYEPDVGECTGGLIGRALVTEHVNEALLGIQHALARVHRFA
jgi:hypothetical protein